MTKSTIITRSSKLNDIVTLSHTDELVLETKNQDGYKILTRDGEDALLRFLLGSTNPNYPGLMGGTPVLLKQSEAFIASLQQVAYGVEVSHMAFENRLSELRTCKDSVVSKFVNPLVDMLSNDKDFLNMITTIATDPNLNAEMVEAITASIVRVLRCDTVNEEATRASDQFQHLSRRERKAAEKAAAEKTAAENSFKEAIQQDALTPTEDVEVPALLKQETLISIPAI